VLSFFKFSLKNAISEIIFLIKELNLSKLKTTSMKRNATAVWNGSLKEGAGKLTTQSTTLKDTQYSFKSRFEEGVGTNPEELVAAAHSGCFTMQLSAYITEGGFEIESIETKCDIELVEGTIITSHLTVNAKVKAITDEVFQQLVTKAEKNCPISKLLNAAISTTATLA
jgi:osmotically inducible protein OsmC